MIRYFMLWYRAKTYCPIIDSLYSEPDMWVGHSAYSAHKMKSYVPKYRGDSGPYAYRYFDSDSLFHKELGIEITYYDHHSSYRQHVKRNGHTLPVSKVRLQHALQDRKLEKEHKIKEAARAELNRVTQDAQTLRLARIVELRKALAIAEAADFAYRLEN